MAKRKNKEVKMSAKDAYDMADDMDLPDGAFWAMAEELSGMDSCDIAAEMVEDE